MTCPCWTHQPWQETPASSSSRLQARQQQQQQPGAGAAAGQQQVVVAAAVAVVCMCGRAGGCGKARCQRRCTGWAQPAATHAATRSQAAALHDTSRRPMACCSSMPPPPSRRGAPAPAPRPTFAPGSAMTLLSSSRMRGYLSYSAMTSTSCVILWLALRSGLPMMTWRRSRRQRGAHVQWLRQRRSVRVGVACMCACVCACVCPRARLARRAQP